MNIAIIPARGGSKRIPRKNVRPFAGRPMLEWPIEAARQAGVFDRIVVSTDDDEVAAAARAAGGLTPFVRPAALADDHATTRAVVNHAIGECTALFGRPDFVCCIYATAPFLEAADLVAALRRLESSRGHFAFSATSYPFPIQRAFRIDAAGEIAMFQPEHLQTRSQDLEPAYHDAGMFYWGRTQAFLDDLPMFGAGSIAHLLPAYRTCDLDTPEDWERAEVMWQAVRTRRPDPC